jgi:3',5'-cyclic AMP phosphodiesterase CpdA
MRKGSPVKFLHLSDLHFHRNASDNKAATAALNFVEKTYPDHYLIVTGDIVDDGHPKQYENALKALRKFQGRIFVCPGNHDFGAVGSFYSRECALRFDEILARGLDQGGTFGLENTPVIHTLVEEGTKVMLIALDSNLETDHPFDFACGQIGEKQLTALQILLAAPSSAEFVKLAFLHHHPFMRKDPFMELVDAKAFLRTIYRRVEVLLFGHRHVSEHWTGRNAIPNILAADNSPGKDWAREITIVGSQVTVEDVRLK